MQSEITKTLDKGTEYMLRHCCPHNYLEMEKDSGLMEAIDLQVKAMKIRLGQQADRVIHLFGIVVIGLEFMNGYENFRNSPTWKFEKVLNEILKGLQIGETELLRTINDCNKILNN